MGDVLANLTWHPFSAGFFAVACLLVLFTKPRKPDHKWASLLMRFAFLLVGMWSSVAQMVQEFNGGGFNTGSAVVSLVASFGVCFYSTNRAQILRFLATWAMLWALPFMLLPLVPNLLRSRFFEGWGFGGILWIPVFLVGAVTIMCLNELERVNWGADEPKKGI